MAFLHQLWWHECSSDGLCAQFVFTVTVLGIAACLHSRGQPLVVITKGA